MGRKLKTAAATLALASGLSLGVVAPANAVPPPMYRDSTCDGTYCYFERSTDGGRSWTMIGWRYQNYNVR